jgi:hypothetical protein
VLALCGKFTIREKYLLFYSLFLLLAALCAQLAPLAVLALYGKFKFIIREKYLLFCNFFLFLAALCAQLIPSRNASLYSKLTYINCLCVQGEFERS